MISLMRWFGWSPTHLAAIGCDSAMQIVCGIGPAITSCSHLLAHASSTIKTAPITLSNDSLHVPRMLGLHVPGHVDELPVATRADAVAGALAHAPGVALQLLALLGDIGQVAGQLADMIVALRQILHRLVALAPHDLQLALPLGEYLRVAISAVESDRALAE